MKLDYFDLISPNPFPILGVGSIKPCTLRDIAALSYRAYSTYIALLGISPQTYCTQVQPQLNDWYQTLSEDDRTMLGMYDIAVSSPGTQVSFSILLDSFFLENVRYDPEQDAFLLTKEDGSITGRIQKNNYSLVCDIILQFNHIDTKTNINLAKVKNKKGLARYMEMQKKKNQARTKPKTDSNLELGNIISAVCARHNSINYTNVWDMTVYQLWDTFARLRSNDVYECGKTAVSVWGDKEHKFDFNSWYKNITN
ncbi:hypothetical protein AALA13_17545 [Lachnospiraceae bacterium 50-23]|jgi:hypothetical protein|nr:hypothetical protein [Dorea sp.]